MSRSASWAWDSSILSIHHPSRSLRSSSEKLLKVPRKNLNSYGHRSFSYQAPTVWNSLPSQIRQSSSLTCFKTNLKTHLVAKSVHCSHPVDLFSVCVRVCVCVCVRAYYLNFFYILMYVMAFLLTVLLLTLVFVQRLEDALASRSLFLDQWLRCALNVLFIIIINTDKHSHDFTATESKKEKTRTSHSSILYQCL